VQKALEFMAPFIKDKTRWPHPRDVQYHDEWPMRHASLLFGGVALDRPAYLELWKTSSPIRTWRRSSATSSSGSHCCG